MTNQAVTGAPPLLWPCGLQRPASPPKLAYLDLNQWIYLAQAATGHSNGIKYLPVLQRCRAVRADGTALFPLSSTHYQEVAKITDPAQRAALAALMEELSGFTSLPSRTIVMRLELDAALTPRLGPDPNHLTPLDLLGPGWGWAIGKLNPLRIHVPEGDVTEQVRQQMGAERFDAMMAMMQFVAERAMLAGPSDEDVPALRARGWDPLTAKKVAERCAAQEQAFEDGLDDQTRRRPQRLRDVILVRELIIELEDALMEALSARGRSITDALGHDKAAARAMARSMPGTEVATTLKVEDHRNRDKRWTHNDTFDIDALSLAIPYCDVVVTDVHRRHVLNTAGLGERMNTIIFAKLAALPDHL